MKKMALIFFISTAATLAQARDDVLMLPLADAVQLGLEQGKLDGSVKFYLSGAAIPGSSERLEDGESNRKTNSVGKSDTEACHWAALSALMAFETSARQRGANAVVDLHSFYKRKPVKDPVNYECHAGNIMAGVSLKGTYARTGK